MSGTEFAKAKEDAAAIMRAKQAAGKSHHANGSRVWITDNVSNSRCEKDRGWQKLSYKNGDQWRSLYARGLY